MIDSCEDPNFGAIAAMLHEVQVRSRDFFYKHNIESTFDLKVLFEISTYSYKYLSMKYLKGDGSVENLTHVGAKLVGIKSLRLELKN